MEKCKYYRTDIRQSPRYSVRTGQYTHSVEEEYSYCTGTREQDECDCNGCESKCTHYPEKVKKYKENSIKAFNEQFEELSVSAEQDLEAIKALVCFSWIDECPADVCNEDSCLAYTSKYDLDEPQKLLTDLLSHIKYLNNVIKSQQSELNVTRQFVHDKGLTFDLLNYSTK